MSVRDKLTVGPSSLAAAEAVTAAAIITYDMMGVQDKKLPRPGPIVATIGFFSMLGLAAAASDMLAPIAVAVGWVLALSVLLTGKRGKGIVKLFEGFAHQVAKIGSNPSSAGG